MRLFEGTPFDVPPTCERCGKLEQDCQCPPVPEPSVPPQQQTARVGTEKRKRGKVVTVIRGLINDGALPSLLTALKTACGAGGSSDDDGTLEIQGEHVERIAQQLLALGYRVANRTT